ncbi:kinase-like domain-containing protein [Syncephalastrum racemosum]|uniref:Kinase-like domain-containing protein n=1 Tax=Syncephalastrum racemosum TaxID=13706 RepID=A0A1X2HGA9_SYNRA|nr:kinase-like domain-containing protein [Syncephalastrum racemosum]
MPFMTYLQQQHHHHHHHSHKRSPPPIPLPPARKRREIGDYYIGKTIGRGASGRVKLGIHRTTGEHVAIKVIARSQLATSATMARCVQRELAVLQLLHHPHLVDLRQVLQDSTNVYFVMEYLEGGELFQVLSERGKLPEDEARHLFQQLTTALAWCHARHICHRDLKPENILLDKDQKHLKIADFGMAAMQTPDTVLHTSCGSPHYASPEIVRGKQYDGQASDVWSCGVILYAMLTGHLPFDDDNVGRLLAKIKTGKYIPLTSVSHEAKDLIKSMLTLDPAKRITLDAVLAHPWLTNQTFSGTDLRFPDALPLHPKPRDLLHDQDLEGPVISDFLDLDGRIWETLKVLWRDLSQDELLAALTDTAPNVPKLTCRLLQQRGKRHDNTRSPSPWFDEPVTPPLTPHKHHIDTSSKCSLNLPPTPCDSTIDTISCCGSRTMADIPATPKSIPTFELDFSWHSFNKALPMSACNPAQPLVSELSPNGVIGSRKKRRSGSCIWTPQKTPSVAAHAASANAAPPTFADDACDDAEAPFMNGVVTSLTRLWDRCLAIVNPTKKPNKIFSFDRSAKHECEAAGKLHQILEEHFNGELSGRLYPTGEIVWSGSIENDRHFVCHMDAVRQGKVRIRLIHTQGGEMETAIRHLLHIWNTYEEDAKQVAHANRWL